MSYANRKQMSSNRTAAIIVVALIHAVLGYGLVTGLAYSVIKNAAEDLKTFDVEDEPPPPPEKPPPPPEDTPPPPQVAAPPPMVRMAPTQSPIQTIQTLNPTPPITYTAPPAPPAPPAPRVSQAAKAKGNLLSLFSNDDYPQAAIRSEESGTTAVRLTIGSDGRVSDCSVTSSSGSSSLDGATCSILRRRARFTPAKDQAGNAISDTYSLRIKWVLPAD